MKINGRQQVNDPTHVRRKGAHSLYTTDNPLNIENRVRVESNYTTRSGDRKADNS